MIESNIDLSKLAEELGKNAQDLAEEAAKARADANAAAAPTIGDALDPLFADKLDVSLAPSRQRLQHIAKQYK